MTANDSSAGAMPAVRSATLRQSYPSGPGWAPYRLPFPGTRGIDPRAVGIAFAGEAGDGGDPPPDDASKPKAGGDAGGASGDDADPSAKDDAKLGDAGKRALDAERLARGKAEERARAAEKERDTLKAATASESEKAIAQAKKDGAAEITDRMHAIVRRGAVREALLTAGAVPSLVSDLSKADEFAALKVNDEDAIDTKELADAVKAHKTRVPDAYKARGDSGTADGGARGDGHPPAKDLTSALERHYAPSQG